MEAVKCGEVAIWSHYQAQNFYLRDIDTGGRHPSLSLESSLHFSAPRHRNRNRYRDRNRNEMTPDNDPDFDSEAVGTV